MLIPDFNKVQSVLRFHYVAEENSLKESLEMTSKQAILRSKICLSGALWTPRLNLDTASKMSRDLL
jgi:hypothetical protein